MKYNLPYFKKGDCHYADEGKDGCWYLHTQGNNKSLNDGEFSCKSCEQVFRTHPEVMMHRKNKHEEEVSTCNKIREGEKCLRKDRCWFMHTKPVQPVTSHVSSKTKAGTEEGTTNVTKNQGFLKSLSTSKPPDQMER